MLKWLRNKDNQQLISWLGAGLVVVATSGWTVFQFAYSSGGEDKDSAAGHVNSIVVGDYAVGNKFTINVNGVNIDEALIQALVQQQVSGRVSERDALKLKLTQEKLNITQQKLWEIAKTAKDKGVRGTALVQDFAAALQQEVDRNGSEQAAESELSSPDLQKQYDLSQIEIKLDGVQAADETKLPGYELQIERQASYVQSLWVSIFGKDGTTSSGLEMLSEPYWLRNQNGDWVNISANTHAVKLIYVSYTHSRCQFGLSVLKLAKLYFAPFGDIQSYFITVDSDDDTVQVIRNFADKYKLPMHILINDSNNEENFAKRLGVFWRKVPIEGGYAYDHPASVLMFDKDNDFAGTIAMGEAGSRVEMKIARLLDPTSASSGMRTEMFDWMSPIGSAYAQPILARGGKSGFVNALESDEFLKCKV